MSLIFNYTDGTEITVTYLSDKCVVISLEEKEQAMVIVKYMNGKAPALHESLADAVEALSEEYGKSIVMDGDLVDTGCIRVWCSEEEAQNDDGRRAVASISLY